MNGKKTELPGNVAEDTRGSAAKSRADSGG